MHDIVRPVVRYKYRPQIKWTAEIIEELIIVWNADEMSTAKMADMFGTSRGSIMGKIDRLRKQGRELKVKAVGKDPQNAPQRRRGSHIQSSSPRRRIVVAPTPVLDPTPPDPAKLVDIHQLEQHHCREVMTLQPKALYCGEDKQRGSSFCPFHHAKNWVPPQPRRR